MLVRVGTTSVEILGTEPATLPPDKDALRAPIVTPGTLRDYPAGNSELVIEILDRTGKILAAYGWTGRPRAFFDVGGGEHGPSLTGGLVSPLVDDRFIVVPLPRDAVFLLFYRSEVVRAGNTGTMLRFVPLGIYDMTAQPGDDSTLPLPSADSSKMDGLLVRAFPCGRVFGASHAAAVPDPPSGSIKDDQIETYLDHGDPNVRFDIVIAGDGFKENELPAFKAEAKTLADALLKMEPFQALSGNINIHLIPTVSDETSITNCDGDNVQRKTYYEVESGIPWNHYRGMGTKKPSRLFDAYLHIPSIKSADVIELGIVLANCVEDAASGWPNLRMAFMARLSPTPCDPNRAANILAHEIGHATGDLAEEYLSHCEATDPNCLPDAVQRYRNMATEDQRLRKTIPWLPDAHPTELDSAGWFKAEHVYGSPMVTDPLKCECGDPILSGPLGDMLGVFWGCQNTDKSAYVSDCDFYYLDAAGKNFYRPMARCKMRMGFQPFCRVCATVLAKKLLSPVLPKSPFSPGKNFVQPRFCESIERWKKAPAPPR